MLSNNVKFTNAHFPHTIVYKVTVWLQIKKGSKEPIQTHRKVTDVNYCGNRSTVLEVRHAYVYVHKRNAYVYVHKRNAYV